MQGAIDPLSVRAVIECDSLGVVGRAVFQWATDQEQHVLIHKEADELFSPEQIENLPRSTTASSSLPGIEYACVRARLIFSHFTGEDPEHIDCDIYIAIPGQTLPDGTEVSEAPSILGRDVAHEFQIVDLPGQEKGLDRA